VDGALNGSAGAAAARACQTIPAVLTANARIPVEPNANGSAEA
jgi:hypothetical protein